MKSYGYRTACAKEDNAEALRDMVTHAHVVSYDTFRRNCAGLDEWAIEHGYEARGVSTLRHDREVRYFRSMFKGHPCFFLSSRDGINYVWTQPTRGDLRRWGKLVVAQVNHEEYDYHGVRWICGWRSPRASEGVKEGSWLCWPRAPVQQRT